MPSDGCCSCFEGFQPKQATCSASSQGAGLAVAIRSRDLRAAAPLLRSLGSSGSLVEALTAAVKFGDPDAKTAYGESALHEAIRCQKTEVARELVKAGATVDAQVLELAQSFSRRSSGIDLREVLLREMSLRRTAEFSEGLSLLPKVPLFAKMQPSEYPRLAAAFTSRTYAPGDMVIGQGEPGHELFIIQAGKAQVIVENGGGSDDSPKKRDRVAVLADGDYFGEGALLNNAPRNATVEAASVLEVKVLTRIDFQSLGLRTCLHFKKRKAVCQGDEGPKKDDAQLQAKTEDEQAQVKSAMLANRNLGPLLKHLDSSNLDRIVAKAFRMDVSQGTEVVKQRELKADLFYVIETGTFDVYKDGQKVTELGPGGSFGELALLFRAPRAATVKAMSPARLWVLPRQELRTVMQAPLRRKLEEFAQLLERVALLKEIKHKEQLADALVETTYYEGEYIIRQGEQGQTLFILHHGEVAVERDGLQVRRLVGQPGSDNVEYFGERALLEDEPRAASVRAISEKVRVLALDREVFLSIQGMDQQAPATSSDLVRYQRERLKTIGLLGCGGFGVVTLVKCQQTNQTFALKALSKGHVLQQKQELSVMNEKRILRMTDSPFLVRLAATFNSPRHLLFLLEPAMGGELFTVYQRMGFHGSELHARFYVGCVLRAFEHLHQRQIIYRDLKPENLLLQSNGYCKVTDFGLAKFVIGHTYTTCGTPEYFAPEMILGSGHTLAVDWWTLGILTYELMMAETPFSAEDTIYVFRKVQRGIEVANFPGDPTWKSLVCALCKKEPSERLVMRPGGVRNVMEHRWFRKFQWEALDQRTMAAPYVPKVKGPEDLANFEASHEDEPPELPYNDPGTGWDKDFEDPLGPSFTR